MQAIRSSNTSFENRVTHELWSRGLRFRKNVKGLMGKPDLAIKKYHIVIFLDSCFWHGCPLHGRKPRSNSDYWEAKLERNRLRDVEVTEYYVQHGWHLLRMWEHEFKCDFDGAIDRIFAFVTGIKSRYGTKT
nr:very short patch repair endonuclease [Alicyclobacillus montanus]